MVINPRVAGAGVPGPPGSTAEEAPEGALAPKELLAVTLHVTAPKPSPVTAIGLDVPVTGAPPVHVAV
jgi:hypothetical protein